MRGTTANGRATLVTALLGAIIALCAWSAPTAYSDPIVKLSAALTPEHLGGGTTIHFGFTVTASAGQANVPIRQIDLLYPANLGIATSGLGLSTCRAAVLEAQGPPGCPSNSIMGYGSALVEVPFGPEILQENTRTTTFMAPLQKGELGLLFFVDGEAPVSAQFVFPGLVLPAPDPFGGDLNASLPLVPSVPEAPDAALVRLTTTLGPSRITYYEYRKGHTIPYRPRGIRLPRTCPRGGFQFGARFTFNDGTNMSAATTVPCPKR
ncbi:MAG TPA: hypothetical protein VGL57_11145 [Solirubrobacteraceae bacterium]